MLVFFAYMYVCHAAKFKYFAYICIYVSVCWNTCHFERSNEKTKKLNPKPKKGITCHGEIIYIYIGIYIYIYIYKQACIPLYMGI